VICVGLVWSGVASHRCCDKDKSRSATCENALNADLRSVLGEVELDSLLSQREALNMRLQSVLDQNTGPWGIKVTMVEIKQVDLPEQMIRAIARQA
jgi:membrane protease subunit (stomatin/prohibitin family)